MGVLMENLGHATPVFKKSGIKTVVEAINIFDMPRCLVHSLHDMRSLSGHIDSLQMQFDCYHMSRMGEDALESLRDNIPLIGHIQFADNPGRHEPGSGDIEYERIFSFLRDSGYGGWCGAEYRPSKITENTLAWLKKWQANQIG